MALSSSWILPDGEVKFIPHESHDSYVANNPEEFGMTENEAFMKGVELALENGAIRVSVRLEEGTPAVHLKDPSPEAFDRLKRVVGKAREPVQILMDGINWTTVHWRTVVRSDSVGELKRKIKRQEVREEEFLAGNQSAFEMLDKP